MEPGAIVTLITNPPIHPNLRGREATYICPGNSPGVGFFKIDGSGSCFLYDYWVEGIAQTNWEEILCEST